MARILVVDDREHERRFLVTLFKHAGHHVIEAEDGLDAIAQMSTDIPDLVVSDILMPTMDGFELVRQMRERLETRNTPVIFYTASYDEAAARVLVKECAAAAILPKPSEPDIVLRTVEGILGSPFREPSAFGEGFRSAHLELVTTKLYRKVSDLKRANDNLRQFAFAAAHDLQEPLRNIVNSLALLNRDWRTLPESDAGELISEATEDAQRLLQMVKDLLAYVQIADDPNHRAEFVDANEIMQQVLKNLSFSISETQAHITCGPLPRVRVASTHLLQLLQNLIANALKYRNRERPARIEISAERLHAEWLFTVADNGIGFEPAYAERIFGIFKRLHNRREYPGTGIGLALCSGIVSGYGGRIWAEGRPGAGASFRFTLPAQPTESHEQTMEQRTKVLIVEDNPLDARLVSYALIEEKRWATETIVIEDGDRAIQYLTEESTFQPTLRPDLVLLDLNLPKVDGTEVLKTIRGTENLRDLPVFVLSSSPEEETRRRVGAAQVAANQYLTKPPDLDGFLALGGTLRRLYNEAKSFK